MDKTCILVSSCNKYADAWEPYIKCFIKYWKDCPYPTYFLTTTINSDLSKAFKFISTDTEDWYTGIVNTLNKLKAEGFTNIIYLQEDYFLQKQVDTSLVENLVKHFNALPHWGFIRLYPCPGPSVKLYKDLGEVLVTDPYYISLQCTLWRIDFLLRVLSNIGHCSPWELETVSKDKLKSFITKNDVGLSVYRDANDNNTNPVIDYLCTAIVKGKWTQQAITFCKNEGININLDRGGNTT